MNEVQLNNISEMIYFNKNKDTIEYIIDEKELSSCFSKKDKININDYTNAPEADVEDDTQESETEIDVEDDTQESETETENDFEYPDNKHISSEPNNWNTELKNTFFYFSIFFMFFRFINKFIYVEEPKCVR